MRQLLLLSIMLLSFSANAAIIEVGDDIGPDAGFRKTDETVLGPIGAPEIEIVAANARAIAEAQARRIVFADIPHSDRAVPFLAAIGDFRSRHVVSDAVFETPDISKISKKRSQNDNKEKRDE